MRRPDRDDWSDVASFTAEPVRPVAGPDRNVHSDHTHVHIVPTAGAVGRWSTPGVWTGRTYGSDAGAPVSRLASWRIAVAVVMVVFLACVTLRFIVNDAGPPPYVPQPTPTMPAVSPHLR